jgi:preprotein translocase subunit SecD
MNPCPSCGTENPDGSRFCAVCGHRLDAGQPAGVSGHEWWKSWKIIALALLVLVAALAGVLVRNAASLDGGRKLAFPFDSPEALSEAKDVIARRIESMGIGHARVSVEADVLVVEVPASVNLDGIDRLRSQGDLLTFRPVLGAGNTRPPQLVGGDDPATEGWFESEDGGYYLLGPAEIASRDVVNAEAEHSTATGQWVVNLIFSDAGAAAFQDLTRSAAQFTVGDPHRQIAITVGAGVISAPQVSADVDPNAGIAGGTAVITMGSGSDQQEVAESLAADIMWGVLPQPTQVVVSKLGG